MGPYIDPRQLEIVLVMAEELHTGKAAERLKLDQSTVSREVRRFEKSKSSPCSCAKANGSPILRPRPRFH